MPLDRRLQLVLVRKLADRVRLGIRQFDRFARMLGC